MSDDGIEGLILRTPAGTYFVPESDLQSYRMPEDVAAQLDEQFDGSEVTGFAKAEHKVKGPHLAEIMPVRWNSKFEPDVSHIMLHTATRM